MIRRLSIVIPFLLLTGHSPIRGQAAPLPPLSFLGFQAGASVGQVREQVHALGGSGLHCLRAKRDKSVMECRGSVMDPGSRRVVDLWLSAMDSASAVLMLSSPLSGVELDGWRSALESAFGTVDANVQGPQWALQWVRAGRMLRLTWRIENGAKVASVSLVDGRVLDGWGRRREAAQPEAGPPGRPRHAGTTEP
jgi:hypothetical protein